MNDFTATASVNVYDGVIRVETSSDDIDILHHDDRVLFTLAHVQPWGADEFSMERADATLTDMGWQRVSEWDGQEPVVCQVRPR